MTSKAVDDCKFKRNNNKNPQYINTFCSAQKYQLSEFKKKHVNKTYRLYEGVFCSTFEF